MFHVYRLFAAEAAWWTAATFQLDNDQLLCKGGVMWPKHGFQRTSKRPFGICLMLLLMINQSIHPYIDIFLIILAMYMYSIHPACRVEPHNHKNSSVWNDRLHSGSLLIHDDSWMSQESGQTYTYFLFSCFQYRIYWINYEWLQKLQTQEQRQDVKPRGQNSATHFHTSSLHTQRATTSDSELLSIIHTHTHTQTWDSPACTK